MNSRVVSPEEERFLKETIRNVIFDLREDDEELWWAAVEELKQVLEIFGESIEDEETTTD